MVSNKDCEAFSNGPDVRASLTVPTPHPRILARLKLVASERVRDTLLAQLDELIGHLDRATPFTARFSVQADTARYLRDQLAITDSQSAASLFLMHKINQHMADIEAKLTTREPL